LGAGKAPAGLSMPVRLAAQVARAAWRAACPKSVRPSRPPARR
jgi:hypothetical protein